MPAEIITEIKKMVETQAKRLFKEAKSIKWDPHALTELDNDNISTEEIKAAIDTIELIEINWTYGYNSPKCLFYIVVPGKPHTHIVVMLSDNNVYVKTGYIASDPKKFKPDGKTRVRYLEK